MIRKVRWAVLGLVLLSPAWAATAVPRVRSINVGESQLNLITSFLASSYEKFGGAKVTSDLEGSTEVIEALAFGLGDDGGLPILLKVQRRSDVGVVLAQVELRIETMDDAPVVCDRIAEALVKQVPLETTMNRHNVVLAENRTRPRLGTEKVLGVKLLFGMPVARAANLNALGAIMFDGRFEKASYFFELGAGFLVPGPSGSPTSEGYGGIVIELGASKYLNSHDTAVYVGGGIMPRLIFSGGVIDSPLNLAPYGQAGVMFDRASRMRLYADLRVAQNVLPVRLSNSPGSTTPRVAYPTEITAALGIGW